MKGKNKSMRVQVSFCMSCLCSTHSAFNVRAKKEIKRGIISSAYEIHNVH